MDLSEHPWLSFLHKLRWGLKRLLLSDFFFNVFIILGLLTLLIVAISPNFVRARAQGRMSGCPSNLKNIGIALEMYSTDNDGRYPERIQALTPNYLKTLPTCPAADRDTYSASYQTGPEAPGNDERYLDFYRIACQGENHRATRGPGDYPAYDGLRGLYERAP